MHKISYQLNDCKLNWIPFTYKDAKINKLFKIVFLLVLFSVIGIAALFSGCVEQNNNDSHTQSSSKLSSDSDTLIVACTIPPQEEFIKAIAGENVNVLVMVPPGASPHTFEPTPSQLTGLESADIYIALGSGIEFENRWMSRIGNMYPNLVIVNVSERIELLPAVHHHEEESKEEHIVITNNENETDSHDTGQAETIDPHIWLSLRNAAEMVNVTSDALKSLRPTQSDTFEQNRLLYLNQMSEVNEKIIKTLNDIPSRKILVFHPAFGYFCNDYQLKQIAIEKDGQEPSARSLANIIDAARKEQISLIFAEPEYSTKGAEKIASEINARLVLITPLSKEYLKNMQHIADSIAG